MSNTRYAGAGWIKKYEWGANISPLGVAVADLLGEVWHGIYHLDPKLLAKVDWANKHYIEVMVSDGLATFDDPKLTWLVVLAHDWKLRMEIQAQHRGRLTLLFHQRKFREGDISKRMPTIEQHLANIRKYHPAPLAPESSEVANERI